MYKRVIALVAVSLTFVPTSVCATNSDLSELALLTAGTDNNVELTSEALQAVGWDRGPIVNYNNNEDQVETFNRSGSCLISFSGVNEPNDVQQLIGGLTLPPVEMCGFQIHAGAVQEVMAFVNDPGFQGVVNFMNQDNCNTVTAAGNSFGGALASIWAACANLGAPIGTTTLGDRTDYALVTFAAPAISTSPFYNGQAGVPFVGTRYAVTEVDGGASYLSGFHVDTKSFRLETMLLLINVTTAMNMTSEAAQLTAISNQISTLSANEIENVWSTSILPSITQLALLLFQQSQTSSVAGQLIRAALANWVPTGILSSFADTVPAIVFPFGFKHPLQSFQPLRNKLAPENYYEEPMAMVTAESAIDIPHIDFYQSVFSTLANNGGFVNHNQCCYTTLEVDECSRQFTIPQYRVCDNTLLQFLPPTPTPTPTDPTYTCGEIRDLYKKNYCCGAPHAPFAFPQSRSLAAATTSGKHRLLTEVKSAMQRADASDLAKQIRSALQPYLS